jgi:hypothetical protein
MMHDGQRRAEEPSAKHHGHAQLRGATQRDKRHGFRSGGSSNASSRVSRASSGNAKRPLLMPLIKRTFSVVVPGDDRDARQQLNDLFAAESRAGCK